jgi:prohibitin 1
LKISKAVADYGSALIEIRRIDAARDIAEILSKSRNITYLPGGQNSGLLLGLSAGQS